MSGDYVWYRHTGGLAESGWQLLLDYDRTQDVPGAVPEPGAWRLNYQAWCAIVCKRLERAGYTAMGMTLKSSTNGWHGKVAVEPDPRSPMETVALQAMLGSDPSRESCNVQRARELERMDVTVAARRLVEDCDRELSKPVAANALARDSVRQLRDDVAFLLEGWEDDGPAAFYRDRWNTLYEPNPKRKRDNGESE